MQLSLNTQCGVGPALPAAHALQLRQVLTRRIVWHPALPQPRVWGELLQCQVSLQPEHMVARCLGGGAPARRQALWPNILCNISRHRCCTELHAHRLPTTTKSYAVG